MELRIGPISINVFQPSGWAYDTGHALTASVGLFKAISGGIGGGRLTVKQTREGLANTGRRYIMPFTQAQVAIGTPWPIPVTASGSLESLPSGGFGPIFRMPGSPDASGESGPPTGLLGTFNLISVQAEAVGGISVGVLLMGANTVLGLEIPGSFKYFTLLWGGTIGSTVSASFSGARGVFLQVDERND